MEHNAIPKIDSIFEPTYPNDSLSFEEDKILSKGRYVTFEDEVLEYDPRGFILDALACAYPDLDLTYHINWKGIVSTLSYGDEVGITRGIIERSGIIYNRLGRYSYRWNLYY
jgi:hypothetical protein